MTTRSWIWVLAACLVWTGLTGRAAAGGSGIAVAMGDLRWGMTESEVIAFVKRKTGTDISKTRVEFEGSKSRWDSSVIAGEFNYGDDESMLSAKVDGAQSFYFFRDGRLWKWYKALDQAKFGGSGGFKKFSSSLEGSFGKGRAKKGELNPNQGETQWVEYMDRNSRMRAADNTKRGAFALIFEDMSVVRELASLRPTKPSRLAGADDDEGSTQKSEPVKTGDSEIARAQTKRSVFANEQQQESEADYQARKQKAANDARDRQQRAHQRKEDAKQGEVLKTLDKIDDKDPLGGL
jgi:hypothetical protein